MAAAPPSPVDLSAARDLLPVAASSWLVVLPVALCIALAALLLMLRQRPGLQGPVAIAGLAALCAVDAALLAMVVERGPVTMVMGQWIAPFGIAFTADTLGAALAFTSALVALAVSIAALGDTNRTATRHGFFPFLLLLMAGVSGAFLTGDIFNLYVWFEVLLMASFGLFALGRERGRIDGALTYAVLNLIATTLFLVAIGMLYALFGALNFADIALRMHESANGTPTMTLAALFVFAFAMKAAAFPVNAWLPASYHTPSVTVSALFGGLLTKVGIYALLRVMTMLFPLEREEMSLLLGVIAAVTMLTGALGAIAQPDLRRMISYCVVSGIGVMLAGLAVAGPGGLSGAIFYALHSMVLIAALYLVAGQAERLAGSGRFADMGGLWQRAPWFSALSLALFLAASGLPPFSGFWPKVIVVKAALDIGAWWLAATVLLTGLITTIAVMRAFLLCYWRPAHDDRPQAAAPLDRPTVAVIAALTLLVAGFGLFPERLLQLTQQSALSLELPEGYIRSVFPTGGGL